MRIGIDIGGTKIEGIAMEGDTEVARLRIASPRGDYEATVRGVRDLVASLQQGLGRGATIGIGVPGAVSDRTGLIKNANSTWLIGKPLDRDLERALGQPVRLENDANCFALSEATDGAARGARTVFGAILGTGTGAGIVVDGKVLVGRNRIAGEWGHNPLPWPASSELPGPACYCGRHGCIETFLSGPGLAGTYAAVGGGKAAAEEIAAREADGDARAIGALEIYENRLARALASIINVLDPDVIVLGGGLSNISRLYRNVPVIWKAFVFSDSAATPLVPALHGDSSGVRGAAWLWKETQ
jgi:fructokinase